MSDSDPSANLFEDANTSHPLDLLINAISGSGQYQIPPEARDDHGHGEFNLESLLSGSHQTIDDAEAHAQRQDQARDLSRDPTSKKRERSPGDIGRESKVARIVKEHVVHSSNHDSALLQGQAQGQENQSGLSLGEYGGSGFSTVEVWHPTAGQKSYGKERRMLNPPPILRVSGPLLPLLTHATLQTTLVSPGSNPSNLASNQGVLSTQSQRIPLSLGPQTSSPPQHEDQDKGVGIKPKRAEKEERARRFREQASKYGFGQTLSFERNKQTSKEREALSEGLIFPALWVAEGIGKEKEFRLELSLGMPGVEEVISINSTSMALGAGMSAGGVMDGAIDAVLGGPTGTHHDDYHPTGNDLFGDHQTLDQASSEIINQMTEEDRKIFESAQQSATAADASVTQPQQDTLGLSTIGDAAATSQDTAPSSRWATFASTPLSVVSKPSQKTTKARSMDSCLGMNDSFALWVRIHGQTVRTKYMKLDNDEPPRLTSRTTQWSPFKFEIIERAAPISSTSERPSNNTSKDRSKGYQVDNVLTYGSIGCLVDLQTGIRTESMRLVKIEKNENVVGTDRGIPVSDLQRVGLVRLVNGQDDYTGGGRWYLSAPGARLGGAELNRSIAHAEDTAKSAEGEVGPGSGLEGSTKVKQKKKKTKRFALAEAVVAEDAGGSEFSLSWSRADRYEGERARGFGKDLVKKVETCEKVEDWMCWVIGGVSNFTYSVFDALQTGQLYQTPLDPVLRNLVPPVFDAESNSLMLTLNEFTDDPLTNFEIYLGPIGPVNTSLYRSVAPDKSGPDNGHSNHFIAEPLRPEPFDERLHPVRSDYPSTKPHIIVVISMPPAETIIRTMQECFAEAQYQATTTLHSVPTNVSDAAVVGSQAEGWFGANNAIESSDHVYIAETSNAGPSSAAPQTSTHENDLGDTPASAEQDPDNALDPALVSQIGEAQNQHNVDDITAALAAHASDPGFSLSQIDDHSFLDPALNNSASIDLGAYQDYPGPGQEASASASTTNPDAHPTAMATEMMSSPPDPELRRPAQGAKKVEMVPLPIVLVRLSDGVGFSVGRNVVAERVDSRGPGEKPRWGLRIVEA